MPANCWGPVVGAKAISYKSAVILGVLGHHDDLRCSSGHMSGSGTEYVYTVFGKSRGLIGNDEL